MKQKSIHFINTNQSIKLDNSLLGIRGKEINELSNLKLPILPCILLDSKITKALENSKIYPSLIPYIKIFEEELKKNYNSETEPMLLKLVISSNLLISNYPLLHNFGLTKKTIKGFEEKVGRDFATHEVLFLLNGIFNIYDKIAKLENKEVNELLLKLKDIKALLMLDKIEKNALTIMNEYESFLPRGFFEDATIQLEESLLVIALDLKMKMLLF